MKKILIIEDDPKITEVLELFLKDEGFETVTAANGVEGFEQAQSGGFDLIILDLGLPGMDGMEIAKQVRWESDVPILILTARSEVLDKVLGLELGADDYMTKPFSLRELTARVKAILRRTGSIGIVSKPGKIAIFDLEIDPEKYAVLRKGKNVSLSAIEFQIVHLMASNPGRVYTRNQLMEHLYDDDVILDRTMDTHIKNIRKKLKDDPRKPKYIETMTGVGYRFKEHDES
jgi:DNA-binding response OmpR family regulator